jgi:hypothetical protein
MPRSPTGLPRFMREALLPGSNQSMMMQSLDGYFRNSQENTERGEKSFGPLPVLFVALHPPLEFRNASAVPVAHQPIHLSFQYAKIA